MNDLHLHSCTCHNTLAGHQCNLLTVELEAAEAHLIIDGDDQRLEPAMK